MPASRRVEGCAQAQPRADFLGIAFQTVQPGLAGDVERGAVGVGDDRTGLARAGALEDFSQALAAGADALLAASVFHFQTFTISQVKEDLARHGYPVRR